MAKHRMPKKRRAHKAMMAAAVAAGLTGPLVLGHAINYTVANLDVDLANVVLGVGGKDDVLSDRVPNKLSGKIARPEWGTDYTYFGVPYPADLNFESSTVAGVTGLTQAITDRPGEGVRIVGYSEGTLVAEAVKRNLADVYDPEDPADVDFLFIASPYLPNGGVFARFPGIRIPGFLPEFGPAEPTPFDSTYVTNEYDTYADFPAYFNPLAIANALLSVKYAHPDPFYDPVDVDNLPAGSKVTTVQNNGAGGTDTYILVYAKHLPLLGPVREVAAILYLTPFTEPVLAAIEPVLRLAIDAGYTDRTNANAAQPTPFSFITPPAKIVEALLGVPGALRQGVTDAVSSGQQSVPTLPVAPLAAKAEAEAQDKDKDEPATGEHLRLAAVAPESDSAPTEPEQVPEPVSDPSAVAVPPKTDSTTTPEPKTESKTEPESVAPITHPTVTSDGNKSEPTTTVSGGTTTAGGGATVTPIVADPVDKKEDSTTPATDSEPAADKAA